MTIYKGYRIQSSLAGIAFYIIKDGCNIATTSSLDEAKAIIDQLS